MLIVKVFINIELLLVPGKYPKTSFAAGKKVIVAFTVQYSESEANCSVTLDVVKPVNCHEQTLLHVVLWIQCFLWMHGS